MPHNVSTFNKLALQLKHYIKVITIILSNAENTHPNQATNNTKTSMYLYVQL